MLLKMLVLFYQDMRAEAEQQVYERLNMKIEEFLELGVYKLKLLKKNGRKIH